MKSFTYIFDKLSIKNIIENSITVKKDLSENKEIIFLIEKSINEIVKAFRNGKKVLICGNGGSAADAQHLATEFSVRFYFDREPLDAESLSVNTSYLTAVSNDLSYDKVFSRLVEAKGKKGDILIAISTSGNSPNIVQALKVAKAKEMVIIGLTGKNGGKMNGNCEYLIKVPSLDTPRIQESHILIGHIICEIVEKRIMEFSNLKNGKKKL